MPDTPGRNTRVGHVFLADRPVHKSFCFCFVFLLLVFGFGFFLVCFVVCLEEVLVEGLTIDDVKMLKEKVYKITKGVFGEIQEILSAKATRLNARVSDVDVDISYGESGDFDAKLKFSGDTLLFHMHTNIFDFEPSHQIHKTAYVKEDKMRSFCGLINIYNFLSDSLKYNRLNDAGFLIARIFINKDGHFFVEGDRELGFLFNDFINQQITKEQMDNIINCAMD